MERRRMMPSLFWFTDTFFASNCIARSLTSFVTLASARCIFSDLLHLGSADAVDRILPQVLRSEVSLGEFLLTVQGKLFGLLLVQRPHPAKAAVRHLDRDIVALCLQVVGPVTRVQLLRHIFY